MWLMRTHIFVPVQPSVTRRNMMSVPSSVMSGGRSSPESPHVYRGGFKLPKHLKSPLHLPDGEEGSAFGIGHASPLLHKSPSMTGLSCYNDGARWSTCYIGYTS